MTIALPRRLAHERAPLGVRLCNWVGEVVLMMPALRRLQEAGYDLHLVGRGWAGALLEGSGWPVIRRPGSLLDARKTWADLRQSIAPHDRPSALLFTKSLSSALETRFAGWRPVGYARDGRTPLLSAAFDLQPYAHAAHMYWNLVSQALQEDAPYPLDARLTPSDRQRHIAHTLLAQQGVQNGEPYVVLCPFSGADDREGRKIWPHHAALGERLTRRGIRTVVCPGPGEESRASALLPHAISLTGTDLGVYAALLEQAEVVVANDTGPGHLAAAVGTRLIALFGPQSVAAWAPLGPHVELYLNATGWVSCDRVEAALHEQWPVR